MRVISFLAQETRDTVAINYVSSTIETVIHQTPGDEGSLATKPTYEYVQLFSGQSSDGPPRLRQSQVRRPRPFGRATHTIRSMEQKDVLKALQRDHAAELKLAAKRLKGTARHTEIIPSRTLSELTGHEILLKPENLQVTGSFKIRGAYNKIASLSEEQIARGIVTASAGNHAQGVAYAARERHAKATICMPQITPPLKVDATKAYGADVVLYGDVFDEAAAHAANPALRTMLNTLYDDFIRQFGNLNDRKNIDLFRMDAGNREILSLERYIDGRAVKADIFDHPVSYNINEITHTDDVHEALTASLNKYGNVDMAYMESLTDKSQSDLLEELRGRIFYNPLSKNYEIADRFISGNVMAKAEHIEEYLLSHPDNGEARISLEALRQSLPTPIPFEDLDFNFGERWIPAGVYIRYASWLFDTDVSVRYTASNDEYSIKADMTSPRIMNQYSVRSESRIFNGIALMRHAIHNTTPNITKTVLDKTGKETVSYTHLTLPTNSRV